MEQMWTMTGTMYFLTCNLYLLLLAFTYRDFKIKDKYIKTPAIVLYYKLSLQYRGVGIEEYLTFVSGILFLLTIVPVINLMGVIYLILSNIKE